MQLDAGDSCVLPLRLEGVSGYHLNYYREVWLSAAFTACDLGDIYGLVLRLKFQEVSVD